MKLIHQKIEEYCHKHTSPETNEAQQILENTRQNLEYSEMLSGRIVGQLLVMLIKVSDARKVLEIGTFTGYSALRIAEALPDDGLLITCEYNERYAEMAQKAFDANPVGDKITLKPGKAFETIAALDESFDFIFLDADKINYPNYYERLLPKLKTNGIMAIDNVLWSGKVLQPDDDKAKAIHRLNQIIADDDRAEQVMLSVRDGLTIVRKIHNSQ